MAESVNALVIGAGIIGSSVAYHLARLGMTEVRVIDPDLEGELSSSELNAGGVRATFQQPLNIEMSKRSIEFFAAHSGETGYRGVGYLWLKTPHALVHARGMTALQRSLGWEVQEWDVAELRRRVPFIDKTDDLGGALFAPRDGLVNPNRVKNFYRSQARALGVVFEDRVYGVGYEERDASGIEIVCRKLPALSHERKAEVLSRPPALEKSGEETRYRASVVVNCAGPWAAHVARTLGYESPTLAVRRQVAVFDSRDVDLSPYGMIVDTSGVYFHPEATHGLAGFAVKDEPQGVNFAYDGEAFFTEHIWPALFERATGLERLKHVTGWAGLYEVSPDESAILGRAHRGKRLRFENVFEAHSFSGHGVMHCHSAGIALAELVVQGRYSELDASPFSAERFLQGKRLTERAVI